MAIVESSVDAAANAVKEQLGPPPPSPVVPTSRFDRGNQQELPGELPQTYTPPPTQQFLGAPVSQMPGYYPPPPPLPQSESARLFPPEPSSPYYGATPNEYPNAGFGNLGAFANDIYQGFGQGINALGSRAAPYGSAYGRTVARGGLIGIAARKLGVPNTITTGGLGALPGSQQTHEQIGGAIGGFGASQVPFLALYAAAPEVGIPTAALDAYFGSQAAISGKQTIDAYQNGQIDAKTALLQLAPDIVMAAPAVFHGLKLAPELKAAVESRPEVQRMGGLAGERGSLEPPVGPEGPKGEIPASAEGANLPVPPETASQGINAIANRLRTAVAEARALGPEQAAMISEQKAGRVAKAAGRLEQGGGLEALHESKSFLAGEYDKPTFAPINLPAEDVNAMVDHIGATNAPYFDRLGALTALEKFTMGVKPQENELAKLEQFFPEVGFKKALEDQIMLRPPEPLPVNPEAEHLKTLPTRGSTQMALNESDPALMAQRREALAASQVSDAARQAEIAKMRAAGDELGAKMLEEAGPAPASGQQLQLGDAVNQAYVGALSESPSPAAKGTFAKILEKPMSLLQLVKTIKTSFDIGWGGRQGWRLLPSNPREWFTMFGRQFKAFGSEQAFEEMQAATKAYPWWQRSQSMERPLAFLEKGTGSPETSGEEFTSPLTKYIPGLKGSEQAYVAPGNLMRAEVMDSNIRRATKALNGPLNDHDFQMLIDNINNATLRGNTKWLGKTNASTIASLLFSVKGQVSGPQFVMDAIRALGPDTSPVVRRIVGERVAAYIAMGMSTLGLAAATGWGLNKAGRPAFVTVDLNKDSKTFGQINVGGFRWNYWGADQPMVRAALAISQGQEQKAPGLPTQEASRLRLTKNFIGGKIAPGVPTWLWDELVNSGFDPNLQQNINTPKGLGLFAGSQVAPIGGSNTIQAYRDIGPAAVAPAFIGEETGLSTSTYPLKATPEEQLRVDVNKAGFAPLMDRRQQAAQHRADYIKKYGGTRAQDQTAANYYDTQPKVKQFLAKLDADELKYWTAHKALLKQVWDFNQSQPSGSNKVDIQITDTEAKKLLGIH